MVAKSQERNGWTDELKNTPNEEQLCGKKYLFSRWSDFSRFIASTQFWIVIAILDHDFGIFFVDCSLFDSTMTMDTISTKTGGGSSTEKDEARKCNFLADKNEDTEATKDKKDEVTMVDVDHSTKPDEDGATTVATVTKSNMTRVVTQVSISESEDDAAAGLGSAFEGATDTTTKGRDDDKDGDFISDDKKREKEFKPHKTVASKKKAKVDTTTTDEEGTGPVVVDDQTTTGDSSDLLLTEDKSLIDVVDLEKLYDFMGQNKNAASKLAGEDLLLLIGYTGVGKFQRFSSFDSKLR